MTQNKNNKYVHLLKKKTAVEGIYIYNFLYIYTHNYIYTYIYIYICISYFPARGCLAITNLLPKRYDVNSSDW